MSNRFYLIASLVLLALVIAVIGILDYTDVASADNPGAPATYDLKTTSNADKSYDLCGGTLTLKFTNDDKTLDWTSTVPVAKVIYKSGPDYYTVDYGAGATSGHIDTAADNSDFNQIYWICAEQEDTTTTSSTTTSTTEKPTTTTTTEKHEETTTTTKQHGTTTTTFDAEFG